MIDSPEHRRAVAHFTGACGGLESPAYRCVISAAAIATGEPSPWSFALNHLHLLRREDERITMVGVGFAGKFTVGELAPVKYRPLPRVDW